MISPTDWKEQVAGQLHPIWRAAMIPMNPAVFQYTFIPQQKNKTNECPNLYPMFQMGAFPSSRGCGLENFSCGNSPWPHFSPVLFPNTVLPVRSSFTLSPPVVDFVATGLLSIMHN